MSELAAAGAALLAAPDPVKLNCHQEQVEINQEEEQLKAETDYFPELTLKSQQPKISNLAVPENDSISSSEDENEDVLPDATSETANDFRAKTLQPQSSAPHSGGRFHIILF